MTRRTAGCVSSSGAAAGVVTTSTGPCRAASTPRSGVVRTTSPRNAVWTTRLRLVNLQHRQECLLRDLHGAHLLHALLSFFLFFKQLALARDVAAVALGEHVLAQRPDRFPRDHLGADRSLDDHLEQLARDHLLQLLGDLAPPVVRLVLVNDDAEGVDRFAIQQDVELDELARAVAQELVIDRRIAAANRLQLVVEIENDFGEWELE